MSQSVENESVGHVTRARSLVTAAGAKESKGLPSPPTDTEKYWYMGRQHRWVLVLQAFAFGLIAISIARFSVSDMHLLLFFIPLTLYGTTQLISLVSGTRKKRTSREDHDRRVQSYAPAVYPTVDVFLPTAGEPLEILQNTYSHVRNLEWPAEVKVWVLDDSARSGVQELAESYGFAYRVRPNRGELKKAGNLRFGFEQSSNELIVILDADFVPRSDFLKELIPYFDDDKVGIVQSPQFFDTKPEMGWLQRCAGATQELFYRWIQPSRDRSGAAICVGSCAIYRRKALEQSGGFAQIGHSEDVHTGVNLLRAGFALRYVPILVSKGLCPDALLGFLNQQYRWCTGSMSLLADQSFHNTRAIKPRQKLCFWAGFLYYISTAVNAFAAPLPALVMLWYLPKFVQPMNSIWLVGALTLWFIVLPMMMQGKWRIDVLRVQTLYSFAHALAIVHVLTGKTRDWVATGSANERVTPLATTIVRMAKAYIALSQIAIWSGLIAGMFRFGLREFWAMILLGAIASYVQLPILFLPAKRATKKPAATEDSPVIDLTNEEPVIDLTQDKEKVTTKAEKLGVDEPEQATLRKFRPDIQGLRAIAVLLVVLYHAHVPTLTGGYVGVDVFFVISGFLITGHLIREVEKSGRVSFLSFYARRIRRLLLPAAFVGGFTLIAARVWGSAYQFEGVSRDAIFNSLYAINYHFAAQGIDYQQADGPQSPLQHFWSLAVEEQFYAVWPMLLMGCVVLGRKYRWHVLAAALTAVVGASMFFSITVTESNAPYAYFSLHTRAWEFALGALVGLFAIRLTKTPSPVAAALSWIGVGMILWSAFSFDESTPFPGTAALIPVLGTAFVIAAGCRNPRRGVEMLLDLRLFQGIGRVSYAWYLWHWPLLILIPLMAGYKFSWMLQVEIVLLALWFAVMTFYLLESPALRSRLRKRLWFGTGFAVTGVSIAMAMLLVATVPSFVGSGQVAHAAQLDKADTAQIQQALDRAMTFRNVPSNLTPSIEKAKEDLPLSTLDGCHANFLRIDQPDCVYGDGSADHTLVLFGDSHAQQWLPALDAVGKIAHWRVVTWTKSACPAATVSVYNENLKRQYAECDTWRNTTIERIKQLHPDVVVMTQSDNVPGRSMTNTKWADSTRATIQNFQSAGVPVTYIMDTPLPSENGAECVAVHLDNVSSCAILRSKAYAYDGRHEAVKAAVSSSNAAVVEPIDWFCNVRWCPVVVDNMLVYRDNSHISSTYSNWLAPMLRPIFTPRH